MPPGWKPGDAIPPELLAAAAELGAAGAPAPAVHPAAAAAAEGAAPEAEPPQEEPAKAVVRPASGAFNFALNQPVALDEWESASDDDEDDEEGSSDSE